VNSNLIMSAAAACPSTSSMPASPILLPTAVDAWRTRVPATGVNAGVDAGIRGTSKFQTIPSNYNSIARPLAVSVHAYRGVDAKQAAPPRGVLR
jgi:hypothetical protein